MSAWWKVELAVTDKGFAQIAISGEITSSAELTQFIAKLEAVKKFLPASAETPKGDA